MIFAGVDAGSRAIKIVLLDGESRRVKAFGISNQGVDQNALAARLFQDLLEEKGIEPGRVSRVVATGYGRNLVAFADARITEITCHAHGVLHHLPEARTVVEIGGQDSKVVRLSPAGLVQDFSMNDRCAAGTGRFLEVVAERLNLTLEDLGPLAGASLDRAAISSMCVVFAETEIIGLLATGAKVEDIVAGVQGAVASRLAALAGRHVEGPVVFTGGVALISGMREALEASLKKPVRIAPHPQFTGALGAALMAARG